jgi:AhpD family alkylhydroperoxidase
VPKESEPLLARTASLFGFVPNLVIAMAADPASLEGYLGALNAFGQSTALTPIEQQIVLIVASRVNNADYSVAVHASLAGKLGALRAVVDAASAGIPVADPRLAAIQALTSAITVNRGDVSNAAIASALMAGLGTAEIVAVSFGVAVKAFANTIALIARPEIDPGFATGA